MLIDVNDTLKQVAPMLDKAITSFHDLAVAGMLCIPPIKRLGETLKTLMASNPTAFMPRKTKKAYVKLMAYKRLTPKEHKRLRRWVTRGNVALDQVRTYGTTDKLDEQQFLFHLGQ